MDKAAANTDKDKDKASAVSLLRCILDWIGHLAHKWVSLCKAFVDFFFHPTGESKVVKEVPPHWAPLIEHRDVLGKDGVRIRYHYMDQRQEEYKSQQKVLVLALGIGTRIRHFDIIVPRLSKEYIIVTWDYRGQFGSLSSDIEFDEIPLEAHAHDFDAILSQEGWDDAYILAWSMGVQVTLKIAQFYPQRVKKMILLNGGDGNVLKSVFQVFLDIPGVHWTLDTIVYLLKHSHAYDFAHFLLGWPTLIRMMLVLFSRLYEKYLTPPFDQNQVVWYFLDLIHCRGHFQNYIKLLHALDEKPFLEQIPSEVKEDPHKTLIVSGWLDFLTPHRLSVRMKKHFPKAPHITYRLGSHFVLMEWPHDLLKDVVYFLDNHPHLLQESWHKDINH